MPKPARALKRGQIRITEVSGDKVFELTGWTVLSESLIQALVAADGKGVMRVPLTIVVCHTPEAAESVRVELKRVEDLRREAGIAREAGLDGQLPTAQRSVYEIAVSATVPQVRKKKKHD